MRSSRLVAFITALIAGVSLLANPALASGSRLSEIEREKADLREKIRAAERQASSITQQLAASTARRAQLEDEIATTSAQLRSAEERVVAAEADLSLARSTLFAIQADLAKTLGRVDDLRDQVTSRSRTAYKVGGGGLYLEIILGSDGVRDFFNRVEYIASVIATERQQIRALEEVSTQLDGDRSGAIARRDDITLKKDALEQERANVARLKQSLFVAKQQVVAEIGNQQRLLEKVKSDKAGYLREMARLEAESRSIASLLRSRQRGQVYKAGSGTKLAWPTTGSVSSGYGYRTHPVFGDRRFHSGIDIAAPYGQSVIAAEAGSVVFAGSKGGYGLTVIIDHGNALATLYAHLSSTNVANGSRVSRASQIGRVGCSGYCTGPHLHFETRINGDPVNPMQFF